VGLATVRSIVQQLGGTILIDSDVGRGSTFRVVLPRAQCEAPAAEPSSSRAEPAAGNAETILLVEDDNAVRTYVREVLEGNGYCVVEAADTPSAERSFRERGDVAVLIADVVMPRMFGTELAAQLTRESPGLKVLFMTGYPDCLISSPGEFEAGAAFMQKPFTSIELLACVRGLIDETLAEFDLPAEFHPAIDAA